MYGDSNLELELLMDLKKLRLEKGWSQEQLADISGVSARTVQRLEKGEKPGMETLKALAAAFETTCSQLQKTLNGTREHDPMKTTTKTTRSLLSYGWKGLLYHVGAFMAFITWLFILSNNFGLNIEVIPVVAIIWGGMISMHVIQLLSAGGGDSGE
jgi:transcriptional regulator with XRE-family HTH domain